MTPSESVDQVMRDRDAHIAERHPLWQPSAAELHISSWHNPPTPEEAS